MAVGSGWQLLSAGIRPVFFLDCASLSCTASCIWTFSTTSNSKALLHSTAHIVFLFIYLLYLSAHRVFFVCFILYVLIFFSFKSHALGLFYILYFGLFYILYCLQYVVLLTKYNTSFILIFCQKQLVWVCWIKYYLNRRK